jgi:hypothetical protein
MSKVIEKYSVWIKNKKFKIKIDQGCISNIMKNLKNNKAGGLNGEKNEMYKYGRETELPRVIATLFRAIIEGGYCPDNINIGLICTIIKDSSQSNQNIENTRPITLSETLAIILEHFILIYLHKRILHRHQFGFRQRSSCLHAVFTLREIMEEVKEKGKNAYAVFLDFSKAFDKVNRVKLLYKLMHHLDPRIWLLVKNYYNSLTLYVQDNNGNISVPFKSKVGVKQGGPASPDLFNDYINKLIIMLETCRETYKLGGLYKGVMVYADDTTLVCDSIESLNKCIKIIEDYCDQYDIIINAKKTKCMIFGRICSIVEPEVRVNGQILEIVESFKFLGVHVDNAGQFKKHVSARRSTFFTGLDEVQKLGVNEKDIPLSMKSILYTSLVRSKLMYGLECINLNKTTIRKDLAILESTSIKMACNLNKLSKTTPLLYALNISPLEVYILKRKLHFILQLLQNKATKELVVMGFHRSINETIKLIGVKDGDKD